MPKKNENLSPEQIKVQLDKRSEQYFNDRYSLIDDENELKIYKSNADEMTEQLNAQHKELLDNYNKSKKALADMLLYQNFSDTVNKGKVNQQESTPETQRLLNDSRKLLEKDELPTQLDEKDRSYIAKKKNDIYTRRDNAKEIYEKNDIQDEIDIYEDTVLKSKQSNHIANNDDYALRKIFADIQKYAVNESQDLEAAADKPIRSLSQEESQQLMAIIEQTKKTILAANELNAFLSSSKNTAKEEYIRQRRAVESKRKAIEKEYKDLQAEYDKNDLDKSHLDGSYVYKDDTLRTLDAMLKEGNIKGLVTKMTEIKRAALEYNVKPADKKASEAVDEFIENLGESENNILSNESEELYKNFLFIFGAMDEEKLNKDHAYTQVRNSVIHSPIFEDANLQDGRNARDITAECLKTGKRLGELSKIRDNLLDERIESSTAKVNNISSFNEKVKQIAEAAGALIADLDSRKKGKTDTTEYTQMYNAIKTVSELDGSKTPAQVIEAIEKMNARSAHYESKRKSIFGSLGKWSKVGNPRLNVSRQAQSLTKGELAVDITNLTNDIKKDKAIDEQLRDNQADMNDYKAEKKRRPIDAKKSERFAKYSALRERQAAEIEASRDLQKNIAKLRDDRSFRNSIFEKFSKLEDKEYKFQSGGVIKMEEGDLFTYTFNNTSIKGVYDKELDSCKLYSVNTRKEDADKLIGDWRKKNKETKENEKLFKSRARKELIKAMDGKKIDELKNDAAKRQVEYKKADGRSNSCDPFKFEKDTLTFTLPEVTIEKNGKRITRKNVKVRASYDKNGLIMDKQLNAAKKELEAPAAKPAAAKK